MNNLVAFIAEFAGVVAVTMILGLSPAFRRRPLIFQFQRREVVVSLSLLALVMLGWWTVAGRLAFLANPLLVGPFVAAPRTGLLAFGLAELRLQAILAAFLAAPFVAALVVRRQPLLSVGLARRLLRPSLYLGVALALMSIFLRGKIYSILNGLTTPAAYALLAAVLVGLAEEFVFRGFIQLRLSGAWGDVWGWLASAGLFVAWRVLVGLLAGAGLASLGLTLIYLAAFSLAQGYIMRRCNHIAALALFHAIHLWTLVL